MKVNQLSPRWNLSRPISSFLPVGVFSQNILMAAIISVVALFPAVRANAADESGRLFFGPPHTVPSQAAPDTPTGVKSSQAQVPGGKGDVHGTEDTKNGVLLRSELRELLRSHPRLMGARERLSATREDERRAYSGFLPNVTLGGDAGPETVDSPGTRSIFGEATDEVRQRATITVTQNLFNGFATTSASRQAMAQTEVAEANVNAVLQSLFFDGILAYYTVLKQRALVSLATENTEVLRQQLSLEDERVTRGSGIAVDVLLAKTRLQLATEQRVRFEGALVASRARYLQVFGHMPEVKRMQHSVSLKAMMPEDLETAIEEAYRNNPALLATGKRIIVARHNKEGARAGYYPSVDLVAEGNWEKDFDGVIGIRRDLSAVLRVSWNIFSGYLTEATASMAAIEQSAAQNDHRDNTRRIVENLRIDWQQFNTARERVKLLDNAVIIAEEVFRARTRLRDSGRDTAINVLDAQREVFAARINHVAARFDAEVAAFAVMASTGMLMPENLGL